jgi:hypothetical protein
MDSCLPNHVTCATVCVFVRCCLLASLSYQPCYPSHTLLVSFTQLSRASLATRCFAAFVMCQIMFRLFVFRLPLNKIDRLYLRGYPWRSLFGVFGRCKNGVQLPVCGCPVIMCKRFLCVHCRVMLFATCAVLRCVRSVVTVFYRRRPCDSSGVCVCVCVCVCVMWC